MSSRIIIHQLILQLLVVAGQTVECLDEKALIVQYYFSPTVSSLHLINIPRDHSQGEGLEGSGIVLVGQREDVGRVAGLHPVDELLLAHLLEVVQPVPVSGLQVSVGSP